MTQGMIPARTRFIEYTGADGAPYWLVDANGVPAQYGRPYVDGEGYNFVLNRDHAPTPDHPYLVVTFAGCPPVHLYVENNELLIPSWRFARIA